VVTSGHVTKMAVTPFDPLYPKTPCCTQTSQPYIFYRIRLTAHQSFTLQEQGLSRFAPVTLTLTLTQWPS